jgi:hypothetical protein
MKQYILHVWRGVEAKVVPVKDSVEKTLAKLKARTEDSVHLLEIDAKGIPSVSDFSVAELEAAGIE